MDKTKNVYEEKAIDIPAIKRHSEEDQAARTKPKESSFMSTKHTSLSSSLSESQSSPNTEKITLYPIYQPLYQL
jgi:hypothetical protein